MTSPSSPYNNGAQRLDRVADMKEDSPFVGLEVLTTTNPTITSIIISPLDSGVS